MKIVAARRHGYRLTFRAAVATAHGRLDHRVGRLLELEAEDGTVGWGDACPIAGFGMEGLHAVDTTLARLAAEALGRAPSGDELDGLLERADRITATAPAARGAFEGALLDLASRLAGQSLAARLAHDAACPIAPALPVSALVAGDTPEEIAGAARAHVLAGFETLKLKVGVLPWSADVSRVEALRRGAGPAIDLRVDANGAWTESVARRALDDLDALGVGLVEQPVAAADLDAMRRLRGVSRVRIAADEAATSLAAVERVLDAGAADVIVLKPAALGGPGRALAVARRARAAGCEVFVTSLLDSALGVAAAAHVAAALGAGRPRDGLATASLFVADVAPAPPVERGRLCLPAGPGIGMAPDPASLARVRTGPPEALGT